MATLTAHRSVATSRIAPRARRQRVRGGALVVASAALALVHGCATPARQQAARLPERHQLKTGQLVVRSDFKLTDDDPLIDDLRDVRQQVLQTLELPKQRRPVVVYLFRDEQTYMRYMQAAHPDLPLRRAFFIGTPAELAVYAYCGDQVREDLRHEYTHGLLHAALKTVPLWLDEGLAEYFEVASTSPGRLNSEHADWLADAVRHGWGPDLQRLEQLEDVNEMQRADYQESWAWVHFLLHETPDGRRLLIDYLQDLRSTPAAPSLAEKIAGEFSSPELRLTAYIASFSTGATGSARLPRAQSTRID
jgi:hypothetical protein